MARAMVSFGMFAALASATARRSRGFIFGSPPPSFAATMIALEHLLQALPRLLSMTAFLCLIPAQCECPAMLPSLQANRDAASRLSRLLLSQSLGRQFFYRLAGLCLFVFFTALDSKGGSVGADFFGGDFFAAFLGDRFGSRSFALGSISRMMDRTFGECGDVP